MRTVFDGVELLYIVSCKDRLKRPADLPLLGEFASVIDDVGATKGFLLCTSGFARSNHDYARSLGIELWTITDMRSRRWRVEVDIPIVYVRNTVEFDLNMLVKANEALVDLNRGTPLPISTTDITLLSTDNGRTQVDFGTHLDHRIAETAFDITSDGEADLMVPGLHTNVANIWVPLDQLSMRFVITRRRYLRYLRPF